MSSKMNCWCVALALAAVSLTPTALGAAKARPVAMPSQPDANGEVPRLLSAFFGLDDSLPPRANALCMGAAGKDGMPVVLSRTVDAETLQPEDFTVFTRSGVESTPFCVTLRPAQDAGELRTVLLIGELAMANVGLDHERLAVELLERNDQLLVEADSRVGGPEPVDES